MHAILNSVVDGSLWLADVLDDLLDHAIMGFGAAAPFIARTDEEGAAE
ncbi:hypothetical protein [Methylobacterium sp. NEAU K]|nr:hypothetical protein [Methylobacterium sp. NEAU K]MDP4003601.1 hypothetical protein [Methylobacterium sp. NEAU K]